LTDFFNPRQPCTHVLSGAPLFPSGFGNVITLVDEAGVEFRASNADSWRPITVTVVGTEDTEFALLDEERGLVSLYARGPDQVLKIESEWGPAGEIALVTPESIDDLHVFYALHGHSRAELWLESGEALDGLWDDRAGLWISASPRMWSGGHEICSVPPLDTFEFGSVSPEVCEATEPLCTSCDADLAAAASLLGSGRCELRLAGPRFN